MPDDNHEIVRKHIVGHKTFISDNQLMHSAKQNVYDNSGSGLTATNVQEAIDEVEAKKINLDQTNQQTIVNGVPLLEATRTIDDAHELVDKYYVDNAVTALGTRYYMVDGDSGIGGYKLTQLNPPSETETNIVKNNVNNDEYIGGWISPSAGTPSKLIAGIYNWNIYAQQTGGSGKKTLKLYWKLIERKSDNSEIVITTSALSNEIGTAKTSYSILLNLSGDYIPNSNSYIVGKIYASTSGSGDNPSITLYYSGVSPSHWEIPTNKEILDLFYVMRDGTSDLTGDWMISSNSITLINGTIKAKTLTDNTFSVTAGAITGVTTMSMSNQLTSTLADGTAPFAVSSTTVCTNLNADLLDGQHASGIAPPIGSIVAYGGTSDPSGWLICDGREISRTTYTNLFTVIGTTYGAGNGSTTFNIPNLKQRFPLGKADSGVGNSLGATGGSIDHTHSLNNHIHTLNNHVHSMNNHSHTMNNHTHYIYEHRHNMASHTHGGTTYASNNNTGVTGGLSHKPDNLHGHNFATGGPNTSYTGWSTWSYTAGPNNNETGVNNSSTTPPLNNTTGSSNDQSGTNNPPFLVVNYIIKY